jgi:hypothetical protein
MPVISIPVPPAVTITVSAGSITDITIAATRITA